MGGTTPAELGPLESQRFFATYAGKGREKMTLLKQTTLSQPNPVFKQSFYQLIEAVIDAVVISP
jgi:hypothetical protein